MIDETILEKEFPHHEGLIYLNHAAVAPWPARTAQAVKEFAQETSITVPADILTGSKKKTSFVGSCKDSLTHRRWMTLRY
jgi:hypothetical protein